MFYAVSKSIKSLFYYDDSLHHFTAVLASPSRSGCRFVIMTTHVVAFLLSALLPLSVSQWDDPLAWLYVRSRQGMDLASRQAHLSACPDVCDCPPTFAVAMYCDGRGLTAVPSVPPHVKYLYLQNNAITALPDSALANATSLVWLMLHHNQLSSEAIGGKVNGRGRTEAHVSGGHSVKLISQTKLKLI